MEITFDNTTISYQVQYGKRSAMSLDISPEGHVTVKAPKNVTIEEIEHFLSKQKKSLIRLQNRLDNPVVITRKKEYSKEENYMVYGKVKTLQELFPDLPEGTPPEEIQAMLKRYYTKETKKVIKKRVAMYEPIIGVKATQVTIVDSSGSWGTCNSRRELTFNYRLSMAPLATIDSVVIHELCHIMHMNHDRSFWRKVGSYDRNYEKNHAFLDQLGFVMTV